MAHSYHHALSSVRQWGGTVDEFLPVHNFFDESKRISADFRHRALRHHAEGIYCGADIRCHPYAFNGQGRARPADR